MASKVWDCLTSTFETCTTARQNAKDLQETSQEMYLRLENV